MRVFDVWWIVWAWLGFRSARCCKRDCLMYPTSRASAHAGGPAAPPAAQVIPTSPFFTQQLNDQAKGMWYLASINADDGEAPWTHWEDPEIRANGYALPIRGTRQIWTKLLSVPDASGTFARHPNILKCAVVQARRPRGDGEDALENLVLVHSSVDSQWLRKRILEVWPSINPVTDFSVSKKPLQWRDVQAICSIGEGLAFAKRDPRITFQHGFEGWWEDVPAGRVTRLEGMHETRWSVERAVFKRKRGGQSIMAGIYFADEVAA